MIRTAQEIIAGIVTSTRTLHIARGALRLNRPHTIIRDGKGKFLGTLEANEILRRLPTEHPRILAELTAETKAERRLAAQHALAELPTVRTFTSETRAYLAQQRRDISVSMPRALEGLDPAGMVMLALLREHRRTVIDTASPAALDALYQAAFARGDAAAFVDVELIEARAASGAQLATTTEQLASAKTLREHVDAVQDFRLDPKLPTEADLADLEQQADTLQGRARLLNLKAADEATATSAAMAFAALRELVEQAGAKGDADDQADDRAAQLADAQGVA